jgi:hypothetical protein
MIKVNTAHLYSIKNVLGHLLQNLQLNYEANSETKYEILHIILTVNAVFEWSRMYKGHLQSLWTHLITLSQKFVDVQWQSLFQSTSLGKSHDSSVDIVLDYGLDDRGSRVWFLAGAGNFSLNYCVQNSSGAHPASYPMGTRGFWAWSSSLTPI